MHIRALALLVGLLPAAVPAQERLVMASVTADLPPPPLPRALPGGAVRLAGAPPAAPGLWLNF